MAKAARPTVPVHPTSSWLARFAACSCALALVGCPENPTAPGATGPQGGGGAGIGGNAGVAGSGLGGSAGSAGMPATGGAAGSGGSLPFDAGADACSELDPRAVPADVAVFPDEGQTPYAEVLAKAQKSIRVMIYMMGYGAVLDALKQKAAAGVDVRVILDQDQKYVNQKYYDQLVAAGAEVIWSDPAFTYMHAKVFIVDEAEAVISTGNYLSSNVTKERNYAVTDADPADVADLVALFEADWQRNSPDLSCTRLLVSPVNARQRIIALINGAQTSIEIESMQFGDTGVRNAVAARKAAGVDVKVLMASASWIDANQDAAAFLKSKGIPARWLGTPPIHVKSLIVDGARAYVGSENLSWTSLDKNREVGLVLTEAPAIQTMQSTFAKDWANGTDF